MLMGMPEKTSRRHVEITLPVSPASVCIVDHALLVIWLSVECRSPACVYHLDLDPVTLILTLDLDTLKMYLHITKNEVCRSRH